MKTLKTTLTLVLTIVLSFTMVGFAQKMYKKSPSDFYKKECDRLIKEADDIRFKPLDLEREIINLRKHNGDEQDIKKLKSLFKETLARIKEIDSQLKALYVAIENDDKFPNTKEYLDMIAIRRGRFQAILEK